MEETLAFLHFGALALGGASTFGIPLVAMMAKASPPDHRAALMRVTGKLRMMGQGAIAILLLTGIVMASAAGLWAHAPSWFWIKLVFVAALIVGIVLAGHAGARAATGDMEAAARARMIALANIGILLLIILSAVLAFH